jgi:type IV secretory pathway VirB3-like protein
MSDKAALKSLISDSYNGMSRPAMFAGIPIMPMVGLLLGGLLSGVAATSLLSWRWGIGCVLVFIAGLFVLRLLCALDAQYLRRVRFGLRRLRLNVSYGKALMLTSINPNWSQFYGQRFSKQRYASTEEGEAAGLRSGRAHGDTGR